MKKSFEKIKKFKLPITIENILIKKPIYTLKKNPDERKKNKFPGKELIGVHIRRGDYVPSKISYGDKHIGAIRFGKKHFER